MASYQILGLRDYINKEGKTKKKDAFYDRNWATSDLSEIFRDPKGLLDRLEVPNEERYDLYWTAAQSAGKREFIWQELIPFDIDHIDTTKVKETIEVAVKALGLKLEETPSLFSGNGVWFFVVLEKPFEDPQFFDDNRLFYIELCHKIDRALRDAQLPGTADSSVFSVARLVRMAQTFNTKPGKAKTLAEVVQPNFKHISFSLRDVAGMPELAQDEVIVKWPTPDTQAVLDGCENIKMMLSAPNSVHESMWYALASILGNLEHGRELWHEYSSKYAKYDRGEAERKLDQALVSSNARTCKNFSSLPGAKCEECKFKGKVKSPINIVGPDFIKTKSTGFHTQKTDAEGKLILGKPNYEDLFRWFEKQHPYVLNHDSESLYTFNGTHFENYTKSELRAFAETHFENCTTQKAAEFSHKVLRNNGVKTEWFDETTTGKMNFQNGVLDVKTGSFERGHTMKQGFRYVIPYDYDPEAKAPLFEEYLNGVTAGDKELQKQLLEFSGYCFSNDAYWEHKALILTGFGRNGKSTFMEVIREVAAQGYSAVPFKHIQDPQFLAPLEGKLFNISEEGSDTSFKDTEMFKTLTAGGEIMIKSVYEKPIKIRNKAKLIISCNEVPPATDASHGYFSRLSVVPFNVLYDHTNRDVDLKEKLFKEKAGILNLFLRAYKDMRERGALFEAKSSLEEVAFYRDNMDPIRGWVDTHVMVHSMEDETKSVPSKDFYSSYASYCDSNGYKPLSSGSFFQKIKNYIKDYAKRKNRPRVDGFKENKIMGITLNKESF